MKSSKKSLQDRGYVNCLHIPKEITIDKSYLETKLRSDIPVDRTEAAIIIKNFSFPEMIPDLINALKTESKLYCKIAISEALESFKDKSVKYLLPYLGKIGNNQHVQLPSKPFEKDSYPLPRDIVGRILIRIGVPVIPEILNNFAELSHQQILEAIDVLGHISFYTKNNEALPLLLNLYTENKDDMIMRWKLIRSFSAFCSQIVISILKKEIAENKADALVWEAERSLRLLSKL